MGDRSRSAAWSIDFCEVCIQLHATYADQPTLLAAAVSEARTCLICDTYLAAVLREFSSELSDTEAVIHWARRRAEIWR